MTDDLYERYKATLRAGHVALLRGALLEAADEYRAAAAIAPSRALPHTSLGGVFLRLGHLQDALTEYAEAVTRAPSDEGALLGQAAGQRVDAAQALDRVAEVQEASGRLPEAADTLRRALELEDSPERLQRHRTLLRQIRLSAGDAAAEQLLARALRLREEPAAVSGTRGRAVEAALAPVGGAAKATNLPESTNPTDDPSYPPPGLDAPGDGPESDAALAEASDAPVVTEPAAELSIADTAHAVVAEPALPRADTPDDEIAAAAQAVIARRDEAEPLVVGVMDLLPETSSHSGDGTEMQRQPTGDELLAAAEAAELSGDDQTLRSLLVWTARAYAREGRFEAGLDAAHRLLQRSPGDVDAHLVLVELYVARDWDTLAIDKLTLLDRLARLNDDQSTHERLCAAATRAFPKDSRLSSICD
jgi:tetratricopeptide (TPR) repeat protein